MESEGVKMSLIYKDILYFSNTNVVTIAVSRCNANEISCFVQNAYKMFVKAFEYSRVTV